MATPPPDLLPDDEPVSSSDSDTSCVEPENDYWTRVDAHPLISVLVIEVDGSVLGMFSTKALAYSYALAHGRLCTLQPFMLDEPGWRTSTLQ